MVINPTLGRSYESARRKGGAADGRPHRDLELLYGKTASRQKVSDDMQNKDSELIRPRATIVPGQRQQLHERFFEESVT